MYMCNIYIFMHKSVQITILLLFPFLKRGVILLFPCSLEKTTDEINKSTYMVSLLMVSSQVFDALIFRYFDIREAIQRVHIVVRLPR